MRVGTRCTRCRLELAARWRWWASAPSSRWRRGALFPPPPEKTPPSPAARVKTPRRNLPLALALGTGAVTLLYVLANVVYLSVLPLQGDPAGASILARGIQHASEDRVATAVIQQIFGAGGAK